MNFDVKSLMCFKKVAELEHMTKAATELYISQAQLSRIITDLENQFSVKFFDRVGKGIKLNACGAEFYKYTQQLFALTDKATKRLQDTYMHEQFQLTVVSNAGMYMPGVTKKLFEEAPQLNFRQMNVTRKKNLALLREGTADFSICCPMPDDIDMNTILLRKEPGVIIYPEHHWLNAYESISLTKLMDEKFVGGMLGFGARDAAEIGYQKYGVKPHYVVETMESSLISSYVEGGVGIAVVPKSLYSRDKTFKFRFCEIEEPMYGVVGIAWMKDRVLSDIDNVFIKAASDYFGSLAEL